MPKKKKKIVKVIDIVPAEKHNTKKPSLVESDQDESPKELETVFKPHELSRKDDETSDSFFEEAPTEELSAPRKDRKPRRIRRYIIAGIIVVACVYWGIAELPKTDIKITMKKDSVSYEESISVKTSIGKINASAKEIPGEIVIKKANKVFEFVPTGQRSEQQKAAGKMTIYNTYSSAPQILVATTRFETPNGKIYRLVNRTTVPGAPGSIEVDIIADQPGAEYNVDYVEKLTIPGFKGSPKFEKFYGKITSPVSAHSRYATDEDIAQAQENGETELKTDLSSLIQLQIPEDMKIVPGSEQFTILSKKVDSTLGANEKFSIVLEAEMKVFVINQEDIHSFIHELALGANAIQEGSEEKTFSISSGKPSVQYASGIMTLPLEIQATYWKKLDEQALKKEIAGKRESEVRSIIISKDGVASSSATFWPFWVSNAPKDIERIRITLE